MSALLDKILALVPDDGRRVLHSLVTAKARASGIDHAAAFAALGELTAAQRIAIEPIDGYTWIRRIAAAEAFPLRARPRSPAPKPTRTRRPSRVREGARG